MKNAYEVRGDITAIIIESKTHGRIETLIDTDDLAMAKEATSWHAQWDKNTESFYVNGRIRDDDGKLRQVGLHRHILGLTDPKIFADHIAHDTLDNRKSQLRVVTNAENQQNGRKRTDNISGHTGVHWHKARNKWQAFIRHEGKRKHLGLFECKNDAIRARESAEKKYHTYKSSIT